MCTPVYWCVLMYTAMFTIYSSNITAVETCIRLRLVTTPLRIFDVTWNSATSSYLWVTNLYTHVARSAVFCKMTRLFLANILKHILWDPIKLISSLCQKFPRVRFQLVDRGDKLHISENSLPYTLPTENNHCFIYW